MREILIATTRAVLNPGIISLVSIIMRLILAWGKSKGLVHILCTTSAIILLSLFLFIRCWKRVLWRFVHNYFLGFQISCILFALNNFILFSHLSLDVISFRGHIFIIFLPKLYRRRSIIKSLADAKLFEFLEARRGLYPFNDPVHV